MNIGFDTETYLIGPRQQAPKLVCGSFYNGDLAKVNVAQKIIDALKYDNTDCNFILCNAAYDMTVLCANDQDLFPLIFQFYKEKKIKDISINEKLHILKDSGRIDEQKYSLAALVDKHLNIDISQDKDDPNSWRLRYSELDGIPIDDWPQDAKDYALRDAELTLKVWEAQEKVYGPPLQDLDAQCFADFCLRLMTVCGIHVDPVAAQELKENAQATVDSKMEYLVENNIYGPKGKKDPTLKQSRKEVQARVIAVYDKKKTAVPKTDKGGICCDKNVMEDIYGEDPVLDALADISVSKGILEKYVPVLTNSFHIVHPNYDVLKKTGRTSSYGAAKKEALEGERYSLNIQQLAREGGVRECFVPRPGFLFLAIDYSYIELVALAYVTQQVLNLDQDALHLFNSIIAGKDPHLVTAATILNRTYDDLLEHKKDPEVKQARQMSKAANFGYPGGLGAATFRAFAKGTYGLVLSLSEAEKLKATWFKTYPEMRKYFEFIAGLEDQQHGGFVVEQLGTDRVRAQATFTSACNAWFQGLVADGAKKAICAVSEWCYLDDSEAAFAPVAFIHDEIIFEIPEGWNSRDHSAMAEILSRIMIDAMSSFMPGLPIKTECSLMRRWYKNAEPVYDAWNGNLTIWSPENG